jgi:hypothetical protein
MITTPAEPKEIIYPKMPNKGLEKNGKTTFKHNKNNLKKKS